MTVRPAAAYTRIESGVIGRSFCVWRAVGAGGGTGPEARLAGGPFMGGSFQFVWPRVILAVLIIPLIVVSCTGMPQAGTAQVPVSSPSAATAPAASSLPLPSDPLAYYHFILGYQAEMAQDSAKAIREYLAALRADNASIALKVRLATLYFSRGDVASALRFADRVAESDVKDPQTLIQIAGIYAAAGQPERALTLYDRAIELQPANGDVHMAKGLLLMRLNKFDEAEQALEKAVQQSKDSAIGYYHLGRMHAEGKRYDRAEANLQRAIALVPSYEPAYLALIGLYEAQQDRAKAVALCRKYLDDVNPHSKDVRQQLIRLLIGEKAYQEAQAELNKILAEDADDLDARLRLGLLYGEMKNYPKAIEELKQILASRPAELKVRDYLGLLYEEVKEHDNAIKAYERNIELNPNYVEGHLHLGFLLYRLKRYPEAQTHLDRVVKLSPKQAEGHILLGLTFTQMEKFQDASQAFESGLVHHPQNADLHFNLGTAYDKLNRFEDLVRAMESALRIDPKHADALNYLGYTYAERGIKIDEAVSLTKRAVALKPNNGYYVDSLAWAFFKQGRLDEALAEMKKAVSLVGDDPVIFEHLGEIYFRQNHLPEAKEAWIKSLELDPSNAKLIERYRERGLGDPTQEERIRQAKRKVSQSTTAPLAVQ